MLDLCRALCILLAGKLHELCRYLLFVVARPVTSQTRVQLLAHQRLPMLLTLLLCLTMLIGSMRATSVLETVVASPSVKSTDAVGAHAVPSVPIEPSVSVKGRGTRGSDSRHNPSTRAGQKSQSGISQQPPFADSEPQRVPVTIRSMHNGRYWQVLGADKAAGARISASAPPQERGMERTVFLLERDGGDEGGGWATLRWLKTRQLLESIPPGLVGHEDDAWRVGLSDAQAH